MRRYTNPPGTAGRVGAAALEGSRRELNRALAHSPLPRQGDGGRFGGEAWQDDFHPAGTSCVGAVEWCGGD